MKLPLVGVLDYGMGNLRSVAKSFEFVGARVVVSDRRHRLETADLLVVPGVGAFDAAMKVLRQKRLDKFIGGWVSQNRPYFGICLGLQLLFQASEEAPGTRGLGILKGRVKKFRPARHALKVPHMGWNRVLWRGAAASNGSCVPARTFRGAGDFFYFVHSFYPQPREKAIVWAETVHGGRFCSAVAWKNVLATQFHPEKSGRNGLHFLGTLLKEWFKK